MTSSDQDAEVRDAIAKLGTKLGPETLAAVHELFRAEQEAFVSSQPATIADIAYGKHPRQQLDLYAPADEVTAKAPVLLWVHGGGFVRGGRSSPDHPFTAHIGRWAGRHGMIGAVMSYRLAPEAGWPSGGEDIAAAVDWIRRNIAQYGGDTSRIVLAGTSAGAVHVATALDRESAMPGVRGAILLSGLYGFTPLEDRDTLYYGAREMYAERMPREALTATDLPLFVACAEFDPPRFQAEALGLLRGILDRNGRLPRGAIVSGHNHFSLACHIGGRDRRLANELLGFVKQICR